MKEKAILMAIETLAHSQGSYGRFLNTLMELKQRDPDVYRDYMNTLESQNFRDTVDLILYLES